jgi:hypothetical protein
MIVTVVDRSRPGQMNLAELHSARRTTILTRPGSHPDDQNSDQIGGNACPAQDEG